MQSFSERTKLNQHFPGYIAQPSLRTYNDGHNRTPLQMLMEWMPCDVMASLREALE